MKYSSPQAYLNKFFKGKNKFIYDSFDAQDQYKNEQWLLTWIDAENFVLSKRIRDFDTGADYYDDIKEGNLIQLVEYMRKNK